MANRRYAVIIGVDDPGVGTAVPALRYAEKDAAAMRRVLCDPLAGVDLSVGAGSSVRTVGPAAVIGRASCRERVSTIV